MRVGVFIPARLQSTRLPRKLLRNDTGMPLLEHTIRRVLEAKRQAPEWIARIVCAVDHPELAEAAENAGVDAVMTGPEHTSGSSRIAYVAKLPQYADLDCIVNVQGDEPEMDPTAILRVAQLLQESSDPMATLVTPIPDESDPRWTDPNTVKCVLSHSGYALYFSRASVPFVREGAVPPTPRGYHHLGIYAYRRDFLIHFSSLPESPLEQAEKLEQLRVLDAGHRIRAAVVETAPAGIDTPEDYQDFLSRWRAGRTAGTS